MNKSSHMLYLNVTTVANQEFIASEIKKLRPDKSYHIAKKMIITPNADLRVLINGEKNEILIKQNTTFELTYQDFNVESMVAVNNNVIVTGYVYF